jgi:outer membrane protein assembly factor BamB
LNPRTGKVRRRFSWKGEKVHQADSTPRSIVVLFGSNPFQVKLPADKAAAEKVAALHPHYETLVFVAKSGEQRTRKILASCAALRYISASGLVYLSHLRGIDVLRPVTGTLLWRLTLHDDTRGGLALVDVKDNEIYTLMGDGSVYALRHPQ